MLSSIVPNSLVFFNSRLVFTGLEPTPEISDNLKQITLPFIALGDGFLTPVRYFGNGNVITISTKYNRLVVEEEKEFGNSSMIGMALRVLCYALTIIPGLILGIAMKAIGYAISSHVRAVVHGNAFLQYAPVVSECGSKARPINFACQQSIGTAVGAAKAKTSWNYPADTLVVYATGDVTHPDLNTLLRGFGPNQFRYFVVVSGTLCGEVKNLCGSIDVGLQRLLAQRGNPDVRRKVAFVPISNV